MDAFLPILLAVGATVGTLLVGRIASRRLATLGFPAVQAQVQMSLRDLLEVERQKRVILEAERDALRVTLAATRHDLDDCERQLDDERARTRTGRRGQA